jgi:NAD(P)-dependent dehydrogenase (short-subunit alcohol dehydrogenase family)
MSGRFARDTAVIPGGAGGIGAAVARRLAAEGAKVAVLDVDAGAGEALVADLARSGTVFLATDVSDAEAVDGAIARVAAELSPPTVLVNCAAWLHDFAAVADTTPEQWERSLGVTLRGTYLSCRAVLPHMVAAGHGSVVNVASVGAQVVFPRHAAYASAKAAVVQLTRSIAVDYGPHGIRANALLPGAIRTPHLDADIGDEADRRRREAMSVLGRFGEPEEMAAAVAFLASDDASYITGAALVADGGWALR